MKALTGLSASRRNIVSNVSWGLAGKAATMAFGLAASVILTRYLGAEGFGLFSGLTAFVAIAMPLTDAGLSGIVSRNLLQAPADEAKILGSANRIRILATMIVVALVWLVAVYGMRFSSQELGYVAVLLVGVLLRPVAVVNFWFEANRSNRHVVWAELIGNAVRTVLIFVCAQLRLPILWVLIAHSAMPVATNIAQIFFYRRLTKVRERWTFDKPLAIAMISQSWFLIASAIANSINLKVDQVLLLQMSSEVQTGLYSAAVRISEIWYSIPVLLMASMFPSVFAAKQRSPEQYRHKLQQIYDIYAMMAIGLAVLISLGAGPLTVLLFGPEYKGAAAILAIHTWAAVFVFMGSVFSRWLIMEDLYYYSLVRHGGGAVVNVLLNVFLIPRYGALGSAFATLISYSTSSYLTLFFSSRTREQATMMTLALAAPIRYGYKLLKRLR